MDKSKFSAGIKAVKREQKSLNSWVKQNSKQFKMMGLAIAGMATTALVAFSKMVKKFVEVGDMIDKMAKRTAFAATTLSELAYAADISGADISMLEKGVKKMSKTIVDASYGLETYLRVFRSLSLNVEELLELSPEEQFMKIGYAIADLESETIKTAAAVDVFGRSGTMLLPLFKEGSEAIEKLRKEAHTLGIVFDEEAAAKAAKLKDAQTALKASFQGLGFAIAEEFVPILTDLTKSITDVVTDFRTKAPDIALGFLEGFKLIAQGAELAIQSIHSIKWAVFSVAKFISSVTETLVKSFSNLGKALMLGPTLEMRNLGKILLSLAEWAMPDMKAITDEFTESVEKEEGAILNIAKAFDVLFEKLDKLKGKIRDTKTETEGLGDATKKYGEFIVETAIPATGGYAEAMLILGNAYQLVREIKGKVIEFTQLEAEIFNITMQANRAAIYSLLDAFQTWGEEGGSIMKHLGTAIGELGKIWIGSMKDIVTATLLDSIKLILAEKAKAIAAAIASLMKALPFPANIAAIGGVIALLSKVFSGLFPKFAEGGRITEGGGIVGEKGPELFIPETPGTIVPAGEFGAGRRIELNFSPVFHINTLDTVSMQDAVRNYIGPELLSMFENKFLLYDFQRALGV